MTKPKAKLDKYLDPIFILFISILFIFGTTISYSNYTVITSVIACLIYILIKVFTKQINKPSKNLLIYLASMIVLVVHSLIVGGEGSFVLLFIAGGLILVSIENLDTKAYDSILNLILITGGLLSFYYVFLNIIGVYSFGQNNLFLPLAANSPHNHLGDFWATSLVILGYKMFTKFKRWHLILGIIGIFFLIISSSRSSIVSLIVGLIYVYKKIGKIRLPKGTPYLLILGVVVIFVVIGSFKTTLFSRPYVLEGLTALTIDPLGIGVGNFGKISQESLFAHNIILEIVVGMGAFSVIFLYWFAKTIFIALSSKNILYTAIFFTILANFMFDTTYIIPTMFWLFFISAGISTKQNA